MSFPACPSCQFPDVPVFDRAIERQVEQTRTGDRVTDRRIVLIHRSYVCAGCSLTFWTTEAVSAVKAKTTSVRHLYRSYSPL